MNKLRKHEALHSSCPGRGAGEDFATFCYFHFTMIYCPHQIFVRTRMLEEGEEGLGSEENQPPIIIDAEVNIVQSSLIAWLVSTKSFNLTWTLNWL